MTPKQHPICRHCKGENILADAYAEWDEDAGNWSLTTTFDNYICNDCGGECRVEWVDVPQEVTP